MSAKSPLIASPNTSSPSRQRSRSRSATLLGMIIKQPVIKDFGRDFSSDIGDYEIIKNLRIIEDISYGYIARYKPSGKIVTLKMTDLQMNDDDQMLEELMDIVKNTKMCRHDNIVTYFTSFVNEDHLWTVLEPLQVATCKQMMLDYYPAGLPNEHVIATIIKDVNRAVAYLHDNHYIHNNIRADNIMITAEGRIVLGGLHQMIQTMQSGQWRKSIFKFVGDPEWMAPEVLSQATTFNEKIDVYSMGITALELMYGRTPFDGWPSLKILLAKLQYEVPSLSTETKTPSKSFQKFIEKTLSKNPTNRPSAEALMEDLFIKSAKNAHYIQGHLLKGITSVNGAREEPLDEHVQQQPHVQQQQMILIE